MNVSDNAESTTPAGKRAKGRRFRATDIEVADEGSTDLEAVSSEAESSDVAATAPADAKSAPENRATDGPFDSDEANPARPYVDLGGVKILPREGLQLRLEVEEGTQRVVAVGLDFAGSTLQVQAFAAPRSTGLWNDIRAQIRDQITGQGGTLVEQVGVFGPELVAEVPAPGPDGTPVLRLARFVGVDGPRWFLRGVIAGDAMQNEASRAAVEELFRSVVVVRGGSPMPPRDLIPLTIPKSSAAI
ncbi:uncharacterized protein DUF3710 [Subtercola boreus]|nr:uncharacterized protein DUF3710 [Subtercola boreus]